MSDLEIKPEVRFWDTQRIDYPTAWDGQKTLLKQMVATKLHNRNHPAETIEQKHYLLFCEHHHVYTLGKTGSADNLLLDDAALLEKQATFFRIDRGGDITYHGPGQITGYPIFDLEHFFTDIHRYVRTIEEAVIRTIAHFGLQGIRVQGASGVWLAANEYKPERKICAIGVHLSRWITMHGFAFNVNTDLRYFEYIIPCGIRDKGVTSLAAELGHPMDMQQVKAILLDELAHCFAFTWSPASDLF